MAKQPLEGIRVLDLGQVWAGPQLGLYLADFGAEVILIETSVRAAMQASTLRMTVMNEQGVSTPITDAADPRSYNGTGRNRRYLTLNLDHPDGRRVFFDLVAKSDIVFDNYSPRGVRKLGIEYEVLSRINPGIIVASLSAMGQYGPWSDIVTYGPSLTALCGLKSVLGYPGEEQLQEDVSDLDPIAATYALLPVLAALRHRQRTGKGQFIDVGQGEAGISNLAEAVLEYSMTGRVMGPNGNRHRAMAPHGIFPAPGEDRWISISVDGDAAWRALCDVLGHPEAADDSRFAGMAERLRHVDAVEELVGQWTADRDPEALAEELQAAGVPAYAVLDAIGVAADEQLAYRRSRRFDVHVPGMESDQVFAGNPWLMGGTPPTLRHHTAPLGADNGYVLGDVLGLDADAIARLEAGGALG